MIGAVQEVHSLLVETGTLPDHTNPCFKKLRVAFVKRYVATSRGALRMTARHFNQGKEEVSVETSNSLIGSMAYFLMALQQWNIPSRNQDPHSGC